MRPRILDLFCGAGGATKGYQRAGFDVIGVDINPQPDYCGDDFYQMDALDFLCEKIGVLRADGGNLGVFLNGRLRIAAIHASPPCQAYTGVPGRRDDHPDLLADTRGLLKQTGLPYVIENVPGAPMPEAFLLCGATFDLPVVRHRLFETSFPVGLVPSLCPQTSWDRAVSHGPGFHPYAHGAWRPAWREHVVPEVWPWMTLEEAGQAIPPAYTRWIGERLLAALSAATPKENEVHQ